ncbi:MAG: cell division protein FtsZ [Alphaproteobacteria bacterium]
MLNIGVPENTAELRPRIFVIGVGGAGGNAVNNMIDSNLEGVEFAVANTDSQALERSLADRRIQIGRDLTRGLGAGADPEMGKGAAEESIDEILPMLDDVNMLFVAAGMGGGTGTGAAPVIAREARDRGILTVGVVTKPFSFEGAHRMKMAEAGIAELQKHVDTLIVIPNQNLFKLATKDTTFADAFKMADDVLHSGVRGVTDLIVMPGLINLDFNDIKSVMGEMGKAMMGTGHSDGENRAVEAAELAISNPLLDDVSMNGARGLLINITGGYDMTLFEADEAANRVKQDVDDDANVIFGATFDEKMEGKIRVSVVATGIDGVVPEAVKTVAEAPKAQVTQAADTTTTTSTGTYAPSTAAPQRHSSIPASAPSAGVIARGNPAIGAAAGAAMQPSMSAGGDATSQQTVGHAEPTATQGNAALKPQASTLELNTEAPRQSEPTPPQADAFVPTSSPERPGGAGRSQSLFQRLIGGKGEEQEATAQPETTQPEATAPAPTREEPKLTTEEAPAEQPTLVHDNEGLSQADREMLEIPSFLRRQAN